MKASWALCSLAPLAAGLSGEPEEVAGLDPVQPAMIPVAGLGPATHVFGAELSLPQGVGCPGQARARRFWRKIGRKSPPRTAVNFPWTALRLREEGRGEGRLRDCTR